MGQFIPLAPVAPRQGLTEVLDPHCVQVVPGHDLLMHRLPNNNILLTLLTHQVEMDGRLVGIVTCRVVWQPQELKAAHARVRAMMDAGPLGVMAPVNALAG